MWSLCKYNLTCLCYKNWRWSHFASSVLCPGVCRFSGYPLFGNQCQECHQCGAGVHDHGCWNQEKNGARSYSWRWGKAECEADSWHYRQAFIRRMLLREKPLSLWPLKLHYIPAKPPANRRDRKDMIDNHMSTWEPDEVAYVSIVYIIVTLWQWNKASLFVRLSCYWWSFWKWTWLFITRVLFLRGYSFFCGTLRTLCETVFLCIPAAGEWIIFVCDDLFCCSSISVMVWLFVSALICLYI